ncbi:hypothetical protein HYH02_008336 [Chlamydomonas schloesseri]|uniref:Uncharacterized protein n=1 Tax=Chlamydomonas schloesseri TaxID=2026947 RepID=A0A835WGK8_9CHLO|nr:hypothetical protein HYH02_008336 [Chlamydomonas schloesseri]|eukprot:KAG2446776.1 hypothetical protein HYH02_008336 [Chlamydomonas schloesseri]
MNPQGILEQKPLPKYFVDLGHSVSRAVKTYFGIDIPYAEGLMIVLSVSVVILSIAVWIWVELGNQADQKAHREELLQAQAAPLSRHSTMGATDAAKASAPFGRLSGGHPSGEPPRAGLAAAGAQTAGY